MTDGFDEALKEFDAQPPKRKYDRPHYKELYKNAMVVLKQLTYENAKLSAELQELKRPKSLWARLLGK